MRLGIIGGGFGVNGHMAAFSDLPEAKVVAVADSGSGRLISQLTDTSLYCSSWRDLMDSSVDAVCVVTPPSSHQELVLALLDAGKHVLCEKPFGINKLQAYRMVYAAKNANVIAAVNFQYRFEPGIQALKAFLEDKLIGTLQSVEYIWLTSGKYNPCLHWTWRNDIKQGGGVIGAFLSHVVDLLHWLTGEHIKVVKADSEVLVLNRPKDDTMMKVTAEDVTKAQFELSSGILAKCHVSNCQPESIGMCIKLLGSLGELVYSHTPPFTADAQRVHLYSDGKSPKLLFNAANCLRSVSEDTRLSALRQLMRCFVGTQRGTYIPNLPSFEDGLAVQQVLDAVRQSARYKCKISC